MSFLDSFDDANAVAAEAMGEPVTLGGHTVAAVISAPLTIEDGNAPGGSRAILGGEIIVPPVINPIAGMKVSLRGMDARVESWECHGSGWLLRLGPVNRAAW